MEDVEGVPLMDVTGKHTTACNLEWVMRGGGGGGVQSPVSEITHYRECEGRNPPRCHRKVKTLKQNINELSMIISR